MKKHYCGSVQFDYKGRCLACKTRVDTIPNQKQKRKMEIDYTSNDYKIGLIDGKIGYKNRVIEGIVRSEVHPILVKAIVKMLHNFK